MKGLGEADETKVATMKKQLSTNLDVYEKILSKQPYLAGEVSIFYFKYKRFDMKFFLIIFRNLLWPIYFICLMVHGFLNLVKVI